MSARDVSGILVSVSYALYRYRFKTTHIVLDGRQRVQEADTLEYGSSFLLVDYQLPPFLSTLWSSRHKFVPFQIG